MNHNSINACLLLHSFSLFSGSAVGLIFPEEADDIVYEVLENILQRTVTQVPEKVKHSAQQKDAGYSSCISRGIVTGNTEVYRK
jgi:hypothetical protein